MRLTTRFDVMEGPLEERLGVLYKFDMTKGVCHMSQKVHIVKVVKEFRMHDCDSATTPSLEGSEPCLEDCKEVPTAIDHFKNFRICLAASTCRSPNPFRYLERGFSGFCISGRVHTINQLPIKLCMSHRSRSRIGQGIPYSIKYSLTCVVCGHA
jgi:hypothetical protein